MVLGFNAEPFDIFHICVRLSYVACFGFWHYIYSVKNGAPLAPSSTWVTPVLHHELPLLIS